MGLSKKTIILQYTGYACDGGGIHALLKTLARARPRQMLLGVSVGYSSPAPVGMRVWRGPGMMGEKIGLVNVWLAWRVARRVRKWLQQGGGHTFHGHSRAGLLVGLWLWMMGQKSVVVSVHCYGRQRWFYRWASRRLGSQLYWLSPAMRQYYGVSGAGWEQCLPGCVEPNLSKLNRVGGEVLRFGGVGRIQRLKRWDLVVDAIALLSAEERSRVSFTHIGRGDPIDEANLKRKAATAGLSSVVTFQGSAPSSTALLDECDVLIVASECEALSIAMLEALAAGVPVIAADSGGAVDVIVPGMNGAIFKDGDSEDLARVIRSWLVDRPKFDPEQIRASSFYVDAIAAHWEQIYRALY